jgi:putative redox protein
MLPRSRPDGGPRPGGSSREIEVTDKIRVMIEQQGRATSEAAIRTHRVLIDRPTAKAGDDRGPMGGELLLASLGGCFMSNLLAAIAAREANVSNVRAAVAGTLDGTPPRFVSIETTVSADCDDLEMLEKLVTIAERSCIVANTLKDAVTLRIGVDRGPVGQGSLASRGSV